MSGPSGRLSAERRLLEAVYADALRAVDSGDAVRRVLRREGAELWVAERPVLSMLTVLAVGKAAGPMAAVVEEMVGDRVHGGLVVTRDALSEPLRKMTHLVGDHPYPGERSAYAARRSLELVHSMPAENVLLVLLSGGASALLSGPPPGVTADDMGELNRLLLASGADIEEVNRVRRHVSVCGGGALARATAAKRIEVLAVSDVPGDRVEVIGSGPFARDQGDFVEAGTFLRDRDLFSGLPPNLRAFLDQGPGPVAEAQERSDRHGLDIAHHIVASNGDAVEAVLRSCRTRGVAPIRITGAMRGEAGRVGASVGALGRILATRETGADRCCLVLGGETTVTLRGSGQGGRNQELALAAALEIAGHHGVSVLAAGTDGSDGPTDAAGAFADAGTVQRGRARGVDALSALSDNDSHGFFATEGGLLRTGPTGTNVMDLALVLSRRS